MATPTSAPQAATAPNRFDEATLPIAIGRLFEMNNYEVEYDVHVHGAQIDLVAKAKGDPFSPPLYIEATIEYVSTEKYGKDTTKFILVKHKIPGSVCLCVSAKGFTAPVRERALEAGITAISYDDLFARFEKFSPYLAAAMGDKSTLKLIQTYEEPQFSDSRGTDYATKWLGQWKTYSPEAAKWLIVLGEYGTGKTSLTRVLQHRWLEEYRNDPTKPIPVRIELRNFSRQFDAKGLLHYFLDANGLGHIPIEFMLHLIRTGRIVLILDGYDEMAQFLNARERRACLSALAELAADGAKGILTSRPNYFTESEELNVFEALYTTLEQNRYHLSNIDKSFIAEEKIIDELVDRYVLNRFERSLQDLTPAQTESLVRRNLAKDPTGQEIILSILRKVFREETSGARQALSGKPVIITYLLELIDEIRKEDSSLELATFTEWQVYKLIVDRLMLRDVKRSSLDPELRRKALQRLAAILSRREVSVADELVFQTMIEEEFRSELRRMQPEDRRLRKEELFEDLRSSATLTRASGTKSDGWVFSHNSLREYLVAEMILQSLAGKTPIVVKFPITGAMRSFAGSISTDETSVLMQALAELWPQRAATYGLGPYLSLLWEAARRQPGGLKTALLGLTGDQSSEIIHLSSVALKDIDFSEDFKGSALQINASSADLSGVDLSGIDLRGSRFDESLLDGVSFHACNLTDVRFSGSLIFECDLSDALLLQADFRNIDLDSDILLRSKDGAATSLSGKVAVGYLRFSGAVTDPVEDFYVFRNHPKFSIVQKVCERIAEQKHSQLRGLTQRGEARADPPFARQLVQRMAASGWITIDKNDLVSATSEGRNVFTQIASNEFLPNEIAAFLAEHK